MIKIIIDKIDEKIIWFDKKLDEKKFGMLFLFIAMLSLLFILVVYLVVVMIICR